MMLEDNLGTRGGFESFHDKDTRKQLKSVRVDVGAAANYLRPEALEAFYYCRYFARGGGLVEHTGSFLVHFPAK